MSEFCMAPTVLSDINSGGPGAEFYLVIHRQGT
jgi:hypothetical protein